MWRRLFEHVVVKRFALALDFQEKYERRTCDHKFIRRPQTYLIGLSETTPHRLGFYSTIRAKEYAFPFRKAPRIYGKG